MEFYKSHAIMNKSLVDVLDSMCILTLHQEPEPKKYVRLEDSAYTLTEDVAVTCQVVTAHNIQQYKNSFHSIKLEDDIDSWLSIMEDDKEDELEELVDAIT